MTMKNTKDGPEPGTNDSSARLIFFSSETAYALDGLVPIRHGKVLSIRPPLPFGRCITPIRVIPDDIAVWDDECSWGMVDATPAETGPGHLCLTLTLREFRKSTGT